MKRYAIQPLCLALALALSPAFAAELMSEEAYASGKDKIEQQAKTDKERCSSLGGNAKDICKAEIKGSKSIARAELDQQFRPTRDTAYKLSMAKSEASYDIGRQRCDDQQGNAKEVCIKQVLAARIVFHDVSPARVMALKMAHLAQHDFLTGLPNRVLLNERLSQAIGLARRHHTQAALLFLDLDHFKRINDSLGHSCGDQLLQSVAARLVAAVRATDTVCRQGGDEFVILLAEIEQPQDAAQVAQMLSTALAAPHTIGGRELHLTLSIGISLYPDDGEDVATLMQSADAAMYHAKSSGRNNYQFFRAEMNASALRRLELETGLRRGLQQHEFMLVYQPKIDIASGRVCGSEALLRWQDPQQGLVLPEQFIPVAEASGLIVPLGHWVLREACRQVKAWLDAGLPAVPVAVNISAVEFRHPRFLEGVATVLAESGLAPRFLELELTESLLMQDFATSAAVLTSLKVMGLSLAIDDFGTGYSSLSYLKRFPIDTLKIDQSFVRDLASDAGNATIVSAVVGMGRSLKQRVIAEGVETAAQLAFLRECHCDEGQGYLFSHPLDVAAFTRLLQANTALPVAPGTASAAGQIAASVR